MGTIASCHYDEGKHFFPPETLSLIGWRLQSDEVIEDIGGEAVVCEAGDVLCWTGVEGNVWNQ